MAQEGLLSASRRHEIERNESFAGAPLARQQTMSNRRYQFFDQPRFDRPRVTISVGVKLWQLRILLRLLELVEIIISIFIVV
jgi:hypothetical protein